MSDTKTDYWQCPKCGVWFDKIRIKHTSKFDVEFKTFSCSTSAIHPEDWKPILEIFDAKIKKEQVQKRSS